MNILIGDRERWFRGEIPSADRPIYVRPAVRVLAADDSPFAAFLNRLCDSIEMRRQSRSERLQSSYRWPLDFRLIRVIYRAHRAGKWRLPRFRRLYPRHIFRRLLWALNAGIDRWLFSPEGNPTFDRLCYALFTFILLYLIAQILRG